MTLMSLWLINPKDKLLFDTSCTICATGLYRTHELTKCSGRQLTSKGIEQNEKGLWYQAICDFGGILPYFE